jgi:hypothetical protein
MKRSLLLFIPLLAFICFNTAHAQLRQNAIGPKLGIYFNNSLFMLGAIGEFPMTPNLDFEPGVESVFGISYTTRIVLDVNGRYSFDMQGTDVRPFVMGGLGLALDFVNVPGVAGSPSASDSRSDFRLNLGGGAVFNSRSTMQFWTGLKLYLLSRESSDVLLQGGVNFYL